jgi:pilus assembly protein CpaC
MLRTCSAIAAIVIFGMTADQVCAAPPASESVSADRLAPESVAPQHILIKIQMLEISRKKLEGFNIERAIADDTDGVSEIIKHRINSKVDAIDMRAFKQTEVFRNLVTTLQKHQVAKVVANPNLVVVSGRRAAFACRDNYELPAATERGKSVQFHTFGTRIDILATALANNNIRAELGIRKTEPDYSHAVAIGRNKVPSIRMRQLDTAYE